LVAVRGKFQEESNLESVEWTKRTTKNENNQKRPKNRQKQKPLPKCDLKISRISGEEDQKQVPIGSTSPESE
jgi:hypothetical protein